MKQDKYFCVPFYASQVQYSETVFSCDKLRDLLLLRENPLVHITMKNAPSPYQNANLWCRFVATNQLCDDRRQKMRTVVLSSVEKPCSSRMTGGNWKWETAWQITCNLGRSFVSRPSSNTSWFVYSNTASQIRASSVSDMGWGLFSLS